MATETLGTLYRVQAAYRVEARRRRYEFRLLITVEGAELSAPELKRAWRDAVSGRIMKQQSQGDH